MKRYIKSSIILLAALAFAGCSKTEEFQYNPDCALQIESVSGISPFALMQEPASKAVISGETLPGDEAAKGIGLFVTAQGGGAYDDKTTGYSNVKYAYSNSKWSAASPIYLSNTTGKLYAYFPYSTDATDLTVIPVESSLNGTDYLYATSQDVSFSNKSVNLQMNHALARLHLTIKKGDKYLSDCNLSKIVLQSKAIDASGTMDITTGAVTATKAADATGTFTLTGSDAVTSAGITKDILLVPASNAEGKKDLILTLTIDGVDAEVKFTADKGLDIRSGIQCNATLTIEDTGIKVEGVGVGTWGDGGSQTVQVSGHTVTVTFSDDDEGIDDDIFTNVKADGDNVIIRALSSKGSHLKCALGEGVFSPLNKTSNLVYTFTIFNIASDITATIGYAKPVTVNVSSNNAACGTAKFVGDCYEGEQVTFTATTKNKYSKFIEWQDADGKTLSTENPYNVTLHSSISVKAVFELLEGVNDINGHLAVNLGGTFWGTENVGAITDLVRKIDNVYGAYYNYILQWDIDFYPHKIAAESWGDNDNYRWTLPNENQFYALKNDCYWEWKDNYYGSGMNGYIIYKAKNDADKGKIGGIDGYSVNTDIFIFLPACGYFGGDDNHIFWEKGKVCYYMSERVYYHFADGQWVMDSYEKESFPNAAPVRPVAVPK